MLMCEFKVHMSLVEISKSIWLFLCFGLHLLKIVMLLSEVQISSLAIFTSVNSVHNDTPL